MPKIAKDHQQKSKPYSRSKPTTTKSNSGSTGSKRSKPMKRSTKLKDEALANQLDGLMEDLTPHLMNKKKQKHKAESTVDDRLALEAAQREYEKVNNDMEDALSLLTKL